MSTADEILHVFVDVGLLATEPVASVELGGTKAEPVSGWDGEDDDIDVDGEGVASEAVAGSLLSTLRLMQSLQSKLSWGLGKWKRKRMNPCIWSSCWDSPPLY